MRKIKVVVLLVQQLQHGFTKIAKVSPNLTVAHICCVHVYFYMKQTFVRFRNLFSFYRLGALQS